MASFSNIPLEILSEILALLPCSDLATTSRISHEFHAASQRLLYRDPCLPTTTAQTTRRPSLEIFLVTLLNSDNDSLVTRVRSLTLHWHQAPGLTALRRNDVSLITAAGLRMGLRARLFFPFPSEAVQFIVLLHLLPNLQVLHMTPPSSIVVGVIEAQRWGTNLPIALQSLREFHCHSRINGHGIAPDTLLDIMRLPCIDQITVDIANSRRVPRDRIRPAAVASTSTVTKMCVTHADFSGREILSIFHVPIALTHFSFSAGAKCRYTLEQFMQGLVPLSYSVRFLHLDFLNLDPTDGDDIEDLTAFMHGSLRQWSALRTLSCSLIPLLGKGQRPDSRRLAQVLPMGIRELAILEDWYWSYTERADEVSNLLRYKQSVVPVLQKVAMMDEEWGCNPRAEARLEFACEAARVRLVGDSFKW